jgi:hypothetical protein
MLKTYEISPFRHLDPFFTKIRHEAPRRHVGELGLVTLKMTALLYT